LQQPTDLSGVLDALAPLRPPSAPFIVGITGAVAAGKSVFAGQLAEALSARGERVESVSTDGFLMTNARLAELGLTDRKGFPESYDHTALARALTEIRLGPSTFPAYSHITYDVDETLARRIDPPDVLILEGLALRRPETGPAKLLDALIYIDAEEADLEAWYVARFLGFWAAAEDDPQSFYFRFRHMDEAAVTGLARMVWAQVNLKNLREHIVDARAVADLVIRKGADHAILTLETSGAA
jgi:type I pantothenate kinase